MNEKFINNRYLIHHKLGDGVMGTVYLVHDRFNNNREAALKIINHKSITNDLIKNEFAIMSFLKHPNVVRVYDFGNDKSSGDYFITMEYIDGKTVDELLKSADGFDTVQKQTLLISLLRACDFIHSRNIIHRDIKPGNIMLNSAGAKLMDFGLADFDIDAMNRKGTITYLAPEVLTGNITHKSDIFSLGITFFDILTQRYFYEDLPLTDILALLRSRKNYQEHCKKQLRLLTESGLADIIGNMIAYDEALRYDTCSHIITDINSSLSTNFSVETDVTRDAYVLGSRFIGRDKELAALTDFLTKDPGRALLITGNAGIGKTRLMTEFKKYCRLHDIFFIEGACYENVLKVYAPLLSIINECLFKCPPALLKTYGPELKKIFPDHEMLYDINVNPPYEPKVEKNTLDLCIADFILQCTAVFSEKTILFVNDIQWMDKASSDVMKLIIEKVCNDPSCSLYVYLSSRIRMPNNAGDLHADTYVITQQLSPFTGDNVARYIQSLFGKNMISDTLREAIPRIHERVGGNPFFLQEFIRALVRYGIIVRDPNYWTITRSIDDIEIPQNLNDLILERLDRTELSYPARDLVELIAVFGRRVSMDVLTQCFGSIHQDLNRLEDLLLIEKEVMDDLLVYRISHDLVRDMIIKKIHDVRQVHATIARAIEEVYADNLNAYIDELAYHYAHTDNGDKAREYLEKAGDKAKANFENNLAITYYNQLRDLLDDRDLKKVDVLLAQGELYYELCIWDKADLVLNKAVHLLQAVPDDSRLGEVYFFLGRGGLYKYDMINALNDYEKALTCFKKVGDKSKIAKCLNSIGSVYYHLNEYDKALEYHKKSLAIADEVHDEVIKSFNIGNMGNIYYEKGDYKLAIECHQHVFAVSKQLNKRNNMAYALYSIAIAYDGLDNFNEALKFFEKSITIARESESVMLISIILVDYAELLFVLERPDEAKVLIDECLSLESGDRQSMFKGHILAAKIHALKGGKKDALNTLLAMLDTAEGDPENARLNYEIWRLNDDDNRKNISLELYRKLYMKTGKMEYKKYIDAMDVFEAIDDMLNIGVNDEVLPDYERIDALKNSVYEEVLKSPGIEISGSKKGEMEHEGHVYASIKDELSMIQSIFKENTLEFQTKLNETNRLLDNKLYDIDRKIKYLDSKNNKEFILSEEKKKHFFFKELLEILHDLNSNLSIDELLERILDVSISLMEADRGIILLFDHDGILHTKKARNNKKEPLKDHERRVSNTIITDVLQKDKAVFIADMVEEEELSKTESIIDLEVKSVMCAPLGRRLSRNMNERRKYPFLSASEKLGIIYLDNKNVTEESNFIGSNLDLFQALVDQASIALLDKIMYEQINIDALTGLYLRPFFELSLESELRYAKEMNTQLTVMMIDVDFFKLINDRYGHPVGDEVLKKMGTVLKETLRTADICGRYGGEEFIVILTNTDQQQAFAVGEKIRAVIKKTQFPSGTLTVSVGIANYPVHTGDYKPDETRRMLIQNADQALYYAKDNGRDRAAVWNETMKGYKKTLTSITDILTGNPIRDFRNVQMLLEVIGLVNEKREIATLLDEILDLILKYIEADRGILLLYDEIKEAMMVKAARLKNGEPYVGEIEYSKKIVNDVFENGENICTSTISEALATNSVMDMGLNTVMCVPLVVGKKRIGVIYIDSTRSLKEFTRTELSFFNAIATQISLAINSNIMSNDGE